MRRMLRRALVDEFDELRRVRARLMAIQTAKCVSVACVREAVISTAELELELPHPRTSACASGAEIPDRLSPVRPSMR
jgi:hypothetical protein